MDLLKFYPEIATWRQNKNNTYQVTIRFDWKGNRVGAEKLQGVQVKEEHWDKKAKEVLKADPGHKFKNQVIRNTLNKHENYFLRRRALQLPVTRELVKTYLTNGSLENFYDYAANVIETKTLADGKPYAPDTKRRYRDEIKRLQEFEPSLAFHQLDVNFLTRYKTWMQNVYEKKDGSRLQPNSIWKALGFIRMVYNEARGEQIIVDADDLFKKFEVGSFVTDYDKIKYLELAQMEMLEAALQAPGLDDLTRRIGWRFLAMCVTGFRISDAMLLNDAFFNDNGDLEIIPQKTKRHHNKAVIPIVSERQKRYLATTLEMPLKQTDGKQFRSTFNNRLKVLAARAGILIDITSHAGRHTMGSFLVDAGVETKAAKAILGVKSDRVIQTYLHLKESKLRTEAEKLNNIF